MKVLALDIEHTYDRFRPYEDGFSITCVGLVWNTGAKVVLWNDHKDNEDTTSWLSLVRGAVEIADIIVAFNLKHDMTILRYYGISFDKKKLHCGMVTEYLLSGMNTRDRTFSLESVAEHYDQGKKIDKVRAYWEDGVQTRDIPKHILEEYVLDDAQKAMNIYLAQQELIDKAGMRKIVDLQNEFTLSLSDMELNGFRFDPEIASKIVQEQASLLTGYELELESIVGIPNINFGSNQQLSAILYGGVLKTQRKEWQIKELKSKPESLYREVTVEDVKTISGLGFKPLPKTNLENGYYKTDKDTVKLLKAVTPEQKKVKQLLRDYSRAKKVKETIQGLGDKGLVNKIRSDGCIHPNLNQTVTATGRLSSSDPNSQNMPRGSTSPIKECIVPTLDGIMQVDLSQIEWRVAAELSQDPMMLHEINNGIDQHAKACTDIMELELTKENRTNAKIFNFRMIYGGTAYGFYMDQKMPNFPLFKWEKIVANFFSKYAKLKEWQDTNVVTVEKQGFLRSPTGRMFVFHKVARKEGLDVYNERQVKNYPVQGVAGGDILPLGAVILRRGLVNGGFTSKLILTVHDSIVLDYKEAEYERLVLLCNAVINNLRTYITKYFEIPWVSKITGEIESGASYGDLKPVE